MTKTILVETVTRRSAVQKIMGYSKSNLWTAVTASEAGSVARYSGGRYGSTPTPPWVFCSCRSGQALASTSTMIRACPRHYVPPTIIGCFSPNEPAAHPAVVASPQGSTCLRQEITLQTCPLTLQTWPSSIGVTPTCTSSYF